MMIYGLPICISSSLRTFQSDMQTFRPHHMFLVPLYVETMNKIVQKTAQEQGKSELLNNLMQKCDEEQRKEQLSSILAQFGGELKLIISGGAPILQSQIDAMENIGIQVLNGYGITECSPVAAVNRNQYFRKNKNCVLILRDFFRSYLSVCAFVLFLNVCFLLLVFPSAHYFLNGSFQVIYLDGLCDVGIHAGFNRLSHIVYKCVSCHSDNRYCLS